MKAIQTKYFGPRDVKGSRIKAWAEQVKPIWVSYDDALNANENHIAAAKKLAEKLEWDVTLSSGTLPDLTMCHVIVGTPDESWTRQGRTFYKHGVEAFHISRHESECGVGALSPVECDDISRNVLIAMRKGTL